MRLFIQRAKSGSVTIAGEVVASIETGLVVLVGFGPSEKASFPETRLWETMLEKLVGMRLFPDPEGKMNLDVTAYNGSILLVPQFTLYADCRKGRRPSFHLAAAPDLAASLFQQFAADLEKRLPGRVHCGVFAADMDVALVNWGPVTILLDSEIF